MLKVLCQCDGGHDAWWYSQPMLSGMAAGTLLMACAILLTGLTFKRIEEFCDILSLPFIYKTTFYSLQNRDMFPNIRDEFTKLSEAVMAVCDPPNNVTVVGDAQCNSPGLSAKYRTYTVMEVDSGAILNFSLMHVGQSTSSVAIDKDRCRETLTMIEDHGLHINVLDTD